jgi:hypothetical protein
MPAREDTDTILYDDGTEPTVRRRLPLGCDQQGRHPEAAEQLDELGLRPPDPEPFPWDYVFWIAVGAVLLFGLFAPLER